jgi:hypothetical protein
MTAAVVDDGLANLLRHLVDLHHDLFDALLVVLGIVLEGRVQVGDIGLVMAVVVDLHRLGVDGGFEGVVRVRQRR